jgi:hypothetical protein
MRKALAIVLAAGSAAAGQPVLVWVDMDAARPGFQATVNVPPGTTTVPGVGVYIWDPAGGRSVLNIGFLGGIDRGIGFGHTPGGHQGIVSGLAWHVGTPVNPANTGWIFAAQQHGFAGSEVQYMEFGASAPAPIAPAPTAPVFTVDIHLSGATAGDRYKFAVMDVVTVWRFGMGGAFTPDAQNVLTTGGDVTPDLTPSVVGNDPDVPQPVPPAAFPVDYVDGGWGPAEVRIGGCYANCDHSLEAPILNVQDFTCFLQEFATGRLYANCDGSTSPPALNVQDFTCFLQQYAAGCP